MALAHFCVGFETVTQNVIWVMAENERNALLMAKAAGNPHGSADAIQELNRECRNYAAIVQLEIKS